jgi:hypothetical protein
MSSTVRPTRRRALALALGAVLALAGCTSAPVTATVDPALFPRREGTAPFGGSVGLFMDPASLEMTVVTRDRIQIGRLPGSAPVRMPVGRIVEEAALASFARAFRDGVRVGESPGEAKSDRETVVALDVASAPQSGRRATDVRLVVQLQLHGADGALLWSNVYDSGLQAWEPQRRPFSQSPETEYEGLLRLTHETAYRLMEQAARDVGEWLRNEQLRERRL